MKSNVRWLVVMLAALMLGGCVRVDVGGDHKPTLGREMIDLYQARQSGAVNDAQYKRLLTKILSSGS